MKTVFCMLHLRCPVGSIARRRASFLCAEPDANQPVTVNGAVNKMDWVDPHSWIYADVKEPDGRS